MIFTPRFAVAALTLAALLAGCDGPQAEYGGSRDDFGDSLISARAPRRIVSLSPATTEILFALGAGEKLVGRSEFDTFPDSALLVPALGNGIRPNVESVLGTKPDLVVLYASADNRGAAARLRAAGVSTLSLKTDHIADFRRAVGMLGAILGDRGRAQAVTDSVDRTLNRVRAATSNRPRPTVFWHIWDAPLITIGAGSFMNELVEIAGGRNVYATIDGPSATVSLEDVALRNPDFILAGPIGATKIAGDPRWKVVRAARDKRILIVDTVLVARPSVRLGEAAVSLAHLLHPGAVR